MIRTIYILAIFLLLSCSNSNYREAISRQLEGMEAAWRSGDKLSVADFYSDHGYLLSGDKIAAQGRQEINNYWTSFRGKPIDWELSTFLMSRSFDDIQKDARWQEVADDIPLWDKFDIPLPESPIYHFGKSDLSFRRFSDAVDTSTVHFLLIWENTSTGYKIYVDTYD